MGKIVKETIHADGMDIGIMGLFHNPDFNPLEF